MPAYYNEIDPYAAQWLRNLIAAGHIAPGDVDERSIVDVRPADLAGYDQCHFFAGIGGWSLALRLADWPDNRPVWTGSCPCQPFSAAGKRKGVNDERHLWPVWFELIQACRPEIVFGEQVASADTVGTELEASFVVAVREGRFADANRIAKKLARSKGLHFHRRWIDGVFADLEGEGYACRHEVLGAHSVGAPHIRQRLWWVADAQGTRGRPHSGGMGDREATWVRNPQGEDERRPCERQRIALGLCADGLMADANRDGRDQAGGGEPAPRRDGPVGDGAACGMGDTLVSGLEGHAGHGDHRNQPGWLDAEPGGSASEAGAVGRLEHAPSDGRIERWPEPVGRSAVSGRGNGFWDAFDLLPCTDGKARRVEPGTFPLAHGVPNRVGRLRAYGNAIAPQVAAEFISAYLDSRP